MVELPFTQAVQSGQHMQLPSNPCHVKRLKERRMGAVNSDFVQDTCFDNDVSPLPQEEHWKHFARYIVCSVIYVYHLEN